MLHYDYYDYLKAFNITMLVTYRKLNHIFPLAVSAILSSPIPAQSVVV